MGLNVIQNNYLIKSRQKTYKINVEQKTGLYSVRQIQLVAGSAISAPANQPTLLVFSNVLATSMDVSWTASVGGADLYLAVRRTSASPTFVPVDGTTYSVGQAVGDGEVRHFSAGVSFSESGLTASTNYFYDIFAVNGAAGTYKFLTTSPLEDNRQTASSFSLLNALHYNGANMYDLTAYSTLSALATKWTWKVWFNLDTAGGGVIYSHYNDNGRRRILNADTTKIQSQIRNAAGTAFQTYTAAFTPGVWYCWFTIFDGDGAGNTDKVKFLKGEVGTDANLVDVTSSIAYTVANPPAVLSTINATSAIYWGSLFNVAAWFNGVMDDRAMWSNNLSYDECDAMYNGGNGAVNLATDCVFHQKLDESDPTTTAVEEIAGLNTTLINCTFTPGTDGWEVH